MAQASNIIHLPVRDFSFEPLNFGGKDILGPYRTKEVYVSMVQRLLELTPAEMKKKAVTLGALLGPDRNVSHLIDDLNDTMKDFEALRDMCEMAAARLTAVHARLV